MAYFRGNTVKEKMKTFNIYLLHAAFGASYNRNLLKVKSSTGT